MFQSLTPTARKPRANEIQDEDYHFINNDEFKNLIKKNEFLEYAEVFNHFYGTTKTPVINNLKNGKNVIFDIDWQGTQQLADARQEDLVSIFILPPSMRELEQRLLSRSQDSADVVAARMSKAADEISHYREYDYILVNRDIDVAVAQVKAILQAERLRRDRQLGLTNFVKKLRAGY